MRQASWEEIFQQNREDVEIKTSRMGRLFAWVSWEEAITLVIVLVGFLTVVRSIDNADWVSEMPSLYPIGFFGLVLGIVLAHIRRVPSLTLHLMGLVAGIASVVIVVGLELQGAFYDRAWDIVERLYDWGDTIWTGGISNDDLPFVVLVVSATFLAAYLASWAVFRWYNAWLALIPGGLALLTNISYLPGQDSVPLFIYLFCAILLLARINLLRRKQAWEANGTRHPDFISLSVLNVTVWIGLGLLAAAWVMPMAHSGGVFYSLWVKITDPIVAPANDLARVFTAIDAKKGSSVHQFGAALPLQGGVSLTNDPVMDVTTSETGFLRAQSYDVYTPQGWLIGSENQITAGAWPALQQLASPQDALNQVRRQVSIQVTTLKKSNVIVSAGQPIDVNVDSHVLFGPVTNDVISLRPADQFEPQAQYRVDSTVSNASANNLREAPTTYSDEVEPYLQLPDSLPQRVRDLAQQITAGDNNPYDKASSLQDYLRGFGIDTTIKAAPHDRDSVDWFLFDTKAGYFDYHASAMVVMLRSLGIPSRLAVGYIIRPGDRQAQSSAYTIRESDAYAWPEVYFPGLGWVEFNPSPGDAVVARSGIDADFVPSGDVDPFFEDEFIPPDAFGPVSPATPDQIDTFVVQEESHTISRVVLTVIVGLVAITALLFLLVQVSWQWGLRSYSYPAQIWEKTLRLGRWSRIRPLPQETPREVIARLRKELPDVEDLDYLSESYMKARYGNRQLTDEERSRLTQVWNKARNGLLSRVLRWR
jgi:transglutaminase-like putative cysteine protease